MVDLLLEIDRDMYGPCVVKEGKEATKTNANNDGEVLQGEVVNKEKNKA
jgi:hypothetical protein